MNMRPLESNEATVTEMDAAATLRRSRVAGFWYLVLAVLSPLNLLFIPAKLISSGDAAATASLRSITLRTGHAPIDAGTRLVAGVRRARSGPDRTRHSRSMHQ